MSVDAILKEVEALSAEERAELMQKLEERFPGPDSSSDLTPAQRTELERRIAAADANPDAGVPWEAVKAESLKRARK
jgi:putative addiction module component (TIGR02574 family)